MLTAIGLSTGGSGYFTCIQNMKLVTNKFKSGGLHNNNNNNHHHHHYYYYQYYESTVFRARLSRIAQRNVQNFTQLDNDCGKYGRKFIYAAVAGNSVDPHEPHSHSARFYTRRPYRIACQREESVQNAGKASCSPSRWAANTHISVNLTSNQQRYVEICTEFRQDRSRNTESAGTESMYAR